MVFNEANSVRDFVRDVLDSVDVRFTPGSNLPRTTSAVLFADEPTGNLDSRTGEEVLQLLRHSSDKLGQTIVMVTHDAHAATYADRIVFLKDGVIAQDCGRLSRDEIYDVIKSLEDAR